jgi:hypothetical protein
LEAVNPVEVDWKGRSMAVETLIIGGLIIVGTQRIVYNIGCQDWRDGLGPGDSQSWHITVFGDCCTQCKL